MTTTLQDLRKKIIEAAANAGEGHIPSAFSILDILWVLYRDILRIDPKNPTDPERDRFILSKGHASLGLYAMLAERGFFPLEDFETFGTFGSHLGGHPDRNKVPGVESSTGSLGHGIALSTGVALGLKIRGSSAKVYTLIGDGECNEGTIWESALLAAHHNLSNLTCVVDYNHSTDRALSIGDVAKKFASFEWETSVIDGHDHEQIRSALTHSSFAKPHAIIANTVKGYGCKSFENNPAWHHKSPSCNDLPAILSEVV